MLKPSRLRKGAEQQALSVGNPSHQEAEKRRKLLPPFPLNSHRNTIGRKPLTLQTPPTQQAVSQRKPLQHSKQQPPTPKNIGDGQGQKERDIPLKTSPTIGPLTTLRPVTSQDRLTPSLPLINPPRTTTTSCPVTPRSYHPSVTGRQENPSAPSSLPTPSPLKEPPKTPCKITIQQKTTPTTFSHTSPSTIPA